MQEAIAQLPLVIRSYELEPLSQATAAWTRHSTVVRLLGDGQLGLGEDVTYEAEDQQDFQRAGAVLPLAGSYTLDSFSRHLDKLPLFAKPPSRAGNWLYRRWAFESAALDLALHQAGTDLGRLLGRESRPLNFVVSVNLGDPPKLDRLRELRRNDPKLGFKVDLSETWTQATVAELAALGGITTVDLKGHYFGSFTGPPPDAAQYRMVAEGLPEAWIEDPWWRGEAWETLRPHLDRVTWDANLHSVADLIAMPVRPRCVNIKPSRFGLLSELFRCYELCEAQGIEMYGGGQFELGPGRAQIQYLASLFHPATSNDVAPSVFNEAELPSELPQSPIRPAVAFGAAG